MSENIKDLESTTFLGKRFTRNQISQIQDTVTTFPDLSLRELAHTICEHFQWVTPKGTYKVQFALTVLEQLENEGILELPEKREKRHTTQKEIIWTERTNTPEMISGEISCVMPIKIEVATKKEDVDDWNEFVSRYHYLGYKRPIGYYLKYFILSSEGKRLGCLLFSYAVRLLPCREAWIGWTEKERMKNLELVINNNRYLIFPWVDVPNLASKVLSLVCGQIADDWEKHHGYRPILLETFVDPVKYRGTCYQAANWQYVGKSGSIKIAEDCLAGKDYYVYPLTKDFRAYLKNEKRLPKIALPKTTCGLRRTENFKSDDPFINLWQKIISLVYKFANEYDQKWQKRERVLNTMIIILFIFRLVFSKNKQGYSIAIGELWDQCKIIGISLPQSKPATASAFCEARKKLDEHVFKEINTKIVGEYAEYEESYRWNNHRIFAVDGSKINLPPQLCAFGYKRNQENVYYPQGLVSCLYQLKSKIPYDFDLVNHQDERRAALSHLSVLKENDIVVYDRGYFSYVLLYYHIKLGLYPVFRIRNNTFKVIEEFRLSNDTDKIVEIIPSINQQQEIMDIHPDMVIVPLKIRLIKYSIADTIYILGTTLLDDKIYRRNDFIQLYHSRWGIEELYKISKILIDVEDFHSQTERGVKQELYAHFVLITLNRIFANQSEEEYIQNQNISNNHNDGLYSREKFKVNFKNCLTTVARCVEGLFIQHADMVRKTINKIMTSIYAVRQKERPNRTYKRQSLKPVRKWYGSNSKVTIKTA